MRQRLSGVSAEFSLAGLLAPLSVETFLDEIWALDHYHVKRGCPGFFDALLSGSSTVDGLLELFRHEPSAVRLVREKTKRAPTATRLLMAASILSVSATTLPTVTRSFWTALSNTCGRWGRWPVRSKSR